MQSEQVNELYTALSKCQGEIRPALKDAANPFFKSKYADLSSVWEACRDALTKNGLCVTQSIMILDGVNCLVTILGHKSGQWVKSIAPIICAKVDAQSFGSAVTYQRRYALSAIVGVSTEDDDGESATDRTRKDKAPEPVKVLAARISEKQARELYAMYNTFSDEQKAGFGKWLKDLGFHEILEVTTDFHSRILTKVTSTFEHNKTQPAKAESPSIFDKEIPF